MTTTKASCHGHIKNNRSRGHRRYCACGDPHQKHATMTGNSRPPGRCFARLWKTQVATTCYPVAQHDETSKRPDRHKAPRRPSQDHHDTRRAPRTPSRQQESQQAPGRQSTRKQRGRCQLLFPKYLRIGQHARNVFSQVLAGHDSTGESLSPQILACFGSSRLVVFESKKCATTNGLSY